MIEKFRVAKGPRIEGNNFDIETYNAPRAQAFVDWVNARLTELNLDVEALSPGDPLNVAYKWAIERAQDGAHDGLPKQMRYHVMQQLARQAIRNNRFANVVECGCWRGHSTLLLESLLQQYVSPHAVYSHLHVFDSFQGLSEFKPQDQSALLSVQAQQKIRESFRSSYDTLADKLSDRAVLYQGWIPDVFEAWNHNPDLAGARGQISFANIDVDLYEPTRDAIAFVYPKLVSGGIIYFDDYGFKIFPGATAAVDEFIAPTTNLFVVLPTGGAFLVKP